MIKYHPDENMLLEYASGALASALSLSVCAHLQFCTQCTKRVKELQVIGGAVLNQSIAEPCLEKSFEQLMLKIDADVSGQSMSSSNSVLRNAQENSNDVLNSLLDKKFDAHLASVELPKVIRKLVPSNKKLRWRGWGALKTAILETGQHEFEVAFQKIKSGGTSVHHGHQSIEVTLVLHGSFSDEAGIYSQGDFLVRYPGEEHKPTATQNQDCLCLSVAGAPVAVTGWLGKLVNPFIAFHPH